MSCNNQSISENFIIEPIIFSSGSTGPIVSACTAVFTNDIISCDGNAEILLGSGETIFNTSIIPTIDATIDIGSPISRFRDINTVSGTSTVWTSTTSVTTALIDLGLDSSGNPREITANNSIIQNDVLSGGTY